MELKWWTFGFLGMVLATLSIIYLQLGIDKRGINMDIRRLTASEKALMSSEKVTIRVNTFRRNDMLKIFLQSFHECPVVDQIQVVWSDTKATPPSFTANFKKTVVEVHHNNSLSNRFIAQLPINTEAVLSIDDDIVVSCDDLDFLVHSWTMNKRTLVGISGRITTYDAVTGLARYRNWQYTWWNGFYNIMLTKGALFHKKYLAEYTKVIPPTFLKYIDDHRNCEDLAMAYVISIQSQSPPVWVKVNFYDVGSGGISSGGSHFDIRSECVQHLEKLNGHKYPWRVAHQKVTRLSYWNTWKLLWSDR